MNFYQIDQAIDIISYLDHNGLINENDFTFNWWTSFIRPRCSTDFPTFLPNDKFLFNTKDENYDSYRRTNNLKNQPQSMVWSAVNKLFLHFVCSELSKNIADEGLHNFLSKTLQEGGINPRQRILQGGVAVLSKEDKTLAVSFLPDWAVTSIGGNIFGFSDKAFMTVRLLHRSSAMHVTAKRNNPCAFLNTVENS